MRRLQSANVSSKLDTDIATTDYLYCNRRSNHPRVHYNICNSCKSNKKCACFKVFKLARVDIYPSTDIESSNTKRKTKRKTK